MAGIVGVALFALFIVAYVQVVNQKKVALIPVKMEERELQYRNVDEFK